MTKIQSKNLLRTVTLGIVALSLFACSKKAADCSATRSCGETAGGGSGGAAGGEESGGSGGAKGEASGGTGGASSTVSPTVKAHASDAMIRLLVGQSVTSKIAFTCKGMADDAELSVTASGLPAGVTAENVNSTVANGDATLEFVASTSAKDGGPFTIVLRVESSDDSTVFGEVSLTMYVAQAAGTLDSSLGTQGVSTRAPSTVLATSDTLKLTGLTVDDAGELHVCGTMTGASDVTGWVHRLTVAGTADSSFGSTGELVNFGEPSSYVEACSLGTDGDLFIYAGTSSGGTTPTVARCLRKVDNSGKPSSTFNSGSDLATNYDVLSMHTHGNGVLTVSDVLAPTFSVIDGSGQIGTIFTPPSGFTAKTSASDSNGLVYFGQVKTTELDVGRLLATGEYDTNFGTNGVAILIGSFADSYYGSIASLLPTSGGGLLALYGLFGKTNGASSVAMKQFTSAGVLDTTFSGGSGVTSICTECSHISAVLQADGKLLVLIKKSSVVTTAGGTTTVEQVFLRRYATNGVLDASFGSAGQVEITGIDSPSAFMAYEPQAQRLSLLGLAKAKTNTYGVLRLWL